MPNVISLCVASLTMLATLGCCSTRQCCDSQCCCGPCDAQTSASHVGEAILASPVTFVTAPVAASKPQLEIVETTKFESAGAELNANSRYRHSPDYSRLLGTIQRVHIPGGEWKIRYARLDEQDEWGGSMVLAPDNRLEDFENGETVYIEGEILADRPSIYLSGPLYRVQTVRKVTERDFHELSFNVDK